MASQPERELLRLLLYTTELPLPETEYRFHPTRKFRLDIAWPDHKIGVEIQGGGWSRGRHHRPKGYRKDCEKQALAMLEGWRILHIVPEQIGSGEAIEWLVGLFRMEEEEEENVRSS